MKIKPVCFEFSQTFDIIEFDYENNSFEFNFDQIAQVFHILSYLDTYYMAI